MRVNNQALSLYQCLVESAHSHKSLNPLINIATTIASAGCSLKDVWPQENFPWFTPDQSPVLHVPYCYLCTSRRKPIPLHSFAFSLCLHSQSLQYIRTHIHATQNLSLTCFRVSNILKPYRFACSHFGTRLPRVNVRNYLQH